MSAICPDGHRSESDDWCDLCGAPLEAAVARADADPGRTTILTATGPGPGPGVRHCPYCSDPNPPDDVFCESCGYDFTTGQLPSPVLETPIGGGALDPPPSRRLNGADWVVEQWVDPAWYDTNGVAAEDPCPTPGVPSTIPLSSELILIGRRSTSRGIMPEIDCTADSAVSRRQAQLTRLDGRWYVEDLGSTNGTHVGKAAGPLPARSLPPGQRCPLAEGDRIYVGAWTRLVVRPATSFERRQ